MLRLGMPPYTYSQTLESCRNGITGHTDLLQKLGDNSVLLETIADSYVASASIGELYTIQATQDNQKGVMGVPVVSIPVVSTDKLLAALLIYR